MLLVDREKTIFNSRMREKGGDGENKISLHRGFLQSTAEEAGRRGEERPRKLVRSPRIPTFRAYFNMLNP